MVNPWRGLAGLPRTSWILAAATLINRAGVMVRPFLAIYLTSQMGLSMEAAGWYLFAYGATTLLAAPLSGRLCDRLGARAVMRTCLVLSAAALLVYPLAHTPATILLATIFFSLFNEMPRPALMTLVSEVVPPEKRKSAIVLSRLAVNLGLAVGPALAGFLVAPRGGATAATAEQFRSLFLIDAGSNLAAALVLLCTRLPRGAGHGAAPPKAGLWSDRRLRLMFIATALSAIVFWQHESALALFIKENLHLTVTLFGRVFQPEEIYGYSITLNTLLIVVLEVELNFLTDRWPQRRNLVVGSLLVALGFGGMAFAHGIGAIAANVVLFTVGEMFLMPAISTYTIAIAPPLRRGSYMGVLTLCFGVGFSIGPWLGTRILHWCTAHGRGAEPLWLSMLAVGLLATWVYSRLPEVTLDGAPESDAAADAEAATELAEGG